MDIKKLQNKLGRKMPGNGISRITFKPDAPAGRALKVEFNHTSMQKVYDFWQLMLEQGYKADCSLHCHNTPCFEIYVFEANFA